MSKWAQCLASTNSYKKNYSVQITLYSKSNSQHKFPLIISSAQRGSLEPWFTITLRKTAAVHDPADLTKQKKWLLYSWQRPWAIWSILIGNPSGSSTITSEMRGSECYRLLGISFLFIKLCNWVLVISFLLTAFLCRMQQLPSFLIIQPLLIFLESCSITHFLPFFSQFPPIFSSPILPLFSSVS